MSSSSASRLEGKDADGPVGFDEGILRGLCDMDVSAMLYVSECCADAFSVRFPCSGTG